MTYPEAAALGIDDLEHGFFVNTQLDPGKQPDKCSDGQGTPTLSAMKPGSAEANALIKLLVDHHVAVTSTLPVFEQSLRSTRRSTPTRWPRSVRKRVRSYLYHRNLAARARFDGPRERRCAGLQNDLGLERQFVASGGLLLAGPGPDRQRRRDPRVRRPPRDSSCSSRPGSRRSRHQDRHAQRRELSGSR